MTMTPAYAAGIIDGEGCLMIRRSRTGPETFCYHPAIAVGMSVKALSVLRKMLSQFGGTLTKRSEKSKIHAEYWVWGLYAVDAVKDFLQTIQPHLELKLEQCRVVLNLCEIIRELPSLSRSKKIWSKEARSRGEVLYKRIKELNSKGPQVETDPSSPRYLGMRLAAVWVAGELVETQRDLFSDTGFRLFSGPFANAGMLDATGLWMQDTSESPNEDDGYSAVSLSQILESDVPAKYYLSPIAAAGILRRAAKRNRVLPEQLRLALESVAARDKTQDS